MVTRISKRSCEIEQTWLIELLKWNNGQKSLYSSLHEVFMYRMCMDISETLFFDGQTQRKVLFNEMKTALVSRNITTISRCFRKDKNVKKYMHDSNKDPVALLEHNFYNLQCVVGVNLSSDFVKHLEVNIKLLKPYE